MDSRTTTAGRQVYLSRALVMLTVVALMTGMLVLAQANALISRASAASGDYASDIATLRSVFSVGTADATDAEIEAILESDIGPGILADITTANLGLNTSRNVHDPAVAQLLMERVEELSGSQLLVETGIDAIFDALDLLNRTRFVFGLYDTLTNARDFIETYVAAFTQIYAAHSWNTLYTAYSNQRLGEGDDSDAAWEFLQGLDGDIQTLKNIQHGTAEAVHGELELTVQAVQFVSDGAQLYDVNQLVVGAVKLMRRYQTAGGSAGGALVLLHRGSQLDVVNDGPLDVTEFEVLDSGGNKIGSTGFVGAGDSTLVDLGTGSSTSAASLKFSVGGMGPVTRSTSGLFTSMFFSTPIPLPVAGASQSVLFDTRSGGHVANGATANYAWTFGDGLTANDPTLSSSGKLHPYACPGAMPVTLLGTAPGASLSRQTSVDIPAPYDVRWSAAGGSAMVAPGVPLSFEADPSIPASTTVTWDYGDGTAVGTGAHVTHQYANAGTYSLTIYVKAQGSQCNPLSYTRQVLVGRSTDWIPLPPLGTNTHLSSAVAGYIVTSNVVIPKGQTLTIGPGVNIKFASGGSCFFCFPWTLQVNGSLVVEGSSTAPVVFTSALDDAAGGHFNGTSGFPAGAVAGAHDWNGISVAAGGSVSFDHTQLRYAQTALSAGSIGTGDVTVKNSQVDTVGTGLSVGGPTGGVKLTGNSIANAGTAIVLSGGIGDFSPTVSGNTITSASTGIAMSGYVVGTVDHTTFTGVTDEMKMSGVQSRTRITNTTVTDGPGNVTIGGGIGGGVTRWVSDLPYAIIGTSVTVDASAQLVIPAGTVIKVMPYNGCLSCNFIGLVNKGTLTTTGTPESPVVFTSILDDSVAGHYGGFTGIPVNTAPSAGSWIGLTSQAGSTMKLAGTTVKYAITAITAAAGGAGTFSMDNGRLSNSTNGFGFDGPTSDLSITNSTFANVTTGVTLSNSGSGASTPVLTGNTFTDTSTGILLGSYVTAAIDQTTFTRDATEISMSTLATSSTVTRSTVTDGAGHVAVNGGAIAANSTTTWVSDLPYAVTAALSVPATSGLVFPAGTVIKVIPGGSCCAAYPITVNGALTTTGTAASPVVLTTGLDDTVAGHYAGFINYPTGQQPFAGSWAGIIATAGSTINLAWTKVKYAATGLSLNGATATPTHISGSTFDTDTTGITSGYPNTVGVQNSTFSNVGTGISGFCSGCLGLAYDVIGSSFVGSSGTAMTLGAGTTAKVRTSKFAAGITGISAAGTGSGDAVGNWWGAATGPRPGGVGALVQGNVAFTPWCTTATCSDPPTITSSGLVLSGVVGLAYSSAFTATGTPGPSFAVATGSLPSGLTLGAEGTVTGTPTAAGSSTFTVSATNDAGTTTSGPFTIVVQPALQVTWGQPAAITYGQPLGAQTLAASANQPGAMAYSILSGPGGATGPVTTGTVLHAGTYSLQAVFTPTTIGQPTPLKPTVTLTVNQSALLVTASDVTTTFGGPVPISTPSYGGLVGGDTVASLTASASCNVTMPPSGAVGTYPGASTCSGVVDPDYAITYRTGSLTVTKAPLTITVTGTQVKGLAASFSATTPRPEVTVTSPVICTTVNGGTAISTTLPVGAYTIDPASCHGATLSDPNFLVGGYQGTLTVRAIGVTTTTLAPALIQKAYAAKVVAVGGKTPYAWSLAAGALPPGVKLSAAGAFSGAPTAVGTFTFTVKVVDKTVPVNSATRQLSITVAPMSITTASLPAGLAGKAYTATKFVVSGGKATLTWTIASGALPPGLKLSTAGALSGMPTSAGASTFTVKVTDGSSPKFVATRAFTLVIAPMTILTSSLPNGTVRKAYTATLKANGGKAALVWSVVSGTLPPGLKLAAGGGISGTATTAGTYTFTVKVSDGSIPKNTATATFTVRIV